MKEIVVMGRQLWPMLGLPNKMLACQHQQYRTLCCCCQERLDAYSRLVVPTGALLQVRDVWGGRLPYGMLNEQARQDV